MVKTLPYSAGGAGLILGRELTSLMMKHENIKQKQYCNKFNKDFKKKWSKFKKNLQKKFWSKDLLRRDKSKCFS